MRYIVYTFFLDFTCGIKPSSRIVGGSEASPYSIPWQVQLNLLGLWPFHACGGTLISPRHVLTAAHCTPYIGDIVVLGEHSLANSSDGMVHEICRKTEHPQFINVTNIYQTISYDFSILHLKKPVDISPRAVPVCLPTSKMGGDFLIGKMMTVSGWGSLHNASGPMPANLQFVKVPGIPNEICQQKYDWLNKTVLPVHLCAGDIDEGGKGACKGDSGGRVLFLLSKLHCLG